MRSKNLLSDSRIFPVQGLCLMVLAALMIFMPLSAYSASKVAKTGQTASYYANDDGDLQLGVDWPIPRFIISDCDGTANPAGSCVTDDLTGLIWLRDANCLATEYSGSDTQGTSGDGAIHWEQAMEWIFAMNSGSYANCAGGENDWRVPNYFEIESLVNYGESNSAAWLNTQGFINVPEGDTDAYWLSSTSYGGRAQNPWYFSVKSGTADYSQLGGSGLCGGARESLSCASSPYLWPVRGSAQDDLGAVNLLQTADVQCYYNTTGTTWAEEADCDDTLWPAMALEDGHPSMRKGLTPPATRYIDVGDGTMMDLMTGLQWTQTGNILYTHGLTPYTVTFTDAADHIDDMNAGIYDNYSYTDWRVPNKRELMSLADLSQNNPFEVLNAAGFVDWYAGGYSNWNLYWTSTTDPRNAGSGGNTGDSYGVAFGEGGMWMYSDSKITVGAPPANWQFLKYYLIPVRTGPSGFMLTITITPAGTGTVANNPAVPVDGYLFEDVDLTPTGGVGYAFGSWAACDTDDFTIPCTMTMDNFKEVFANFIPPTVDTSVAFGAADVGTTPTRTVTVTNDGLTDLVIDDIGGVDSVALPFSLNLDTCTASTTLTSGSTCDLIVGFTPTGAGVFADSFNISGSITVNLSGTGVSAAAGPDISVTSNALDFTNTPVSTAPVQTVTVTNDGSANLTNIAITGPSAPFSISWTDCGATLGAGATCDIDVTYTAPGAPQGPDISGIDIASDDPDEDPVTISLMGSAIGGGNNPPVKPRLQLPLNGATGVVGLQFDWDPAESDDGSPGWDPLLVDPDGDTVNHTVYYGTDPSFTTGTTVIASAADVSGVSYAMVLGNPVFMIALFGLVAFGVFLRRKKIALIIIAVMFTGLLLVSCGNHKSDDPGSTAAGGAGGGALQAGTTYYWKVVADDGNGGVTPSDTWSFTTAP